MKMSVPSFSIVVPVYKVLPYLQACLDSVLAQAFSSWECLCVDDGSPDESGDVLDRYSRLDGRIRVIHQRNGGPPAARNRALGNTRGAYVIFLDSDDLLAPGILQHVVSILRTERPEVLTWGYHVFNDGDSIPSLATQTTEVRRYTGDGAIKYLIENKIRYGYVWTLCINRAFLGRLRFPLIGYVEDMMFVADMAKTLCSLTETTQVGIFYRRRRGQITSMRSIESYRAQQVGWAHAFVCYGLRCTKNALLHKLLVNVLQRVYVHDTIALCCYGEASGIYQALRHFFRACPELKPSDYSFKAVLCNALAVYGISGCTRVSLFVLGRILVVLRLVKQRLCL